MTIYKKLLDCADDERKYYINLNTKTLRIGKKNYIKDGEVKVDEDLIDKNDLSNILGIEIKGNSYEVIKKLYKEFKHSIPRENYKSKSYFKALKEEELTLDELAFNFDRYFAQAMFEGYILLAGMKGWIEWKNDEYFFWQSEEDKNLVILKEWVKKN